MAKKIVGEQIKLSIVIDGNQAQSELYKVEKSTRELTAVNKTLLAEKNKLERQGKKESEEYKKLTSTIRQNNQVIKENKARISELQNQIGITGMTMGQLNQKATQLKLTLKHLVPGSPDYVRYQSDLNKITARLDELKGKAQATKITFGTVADGFNRYAALGASVIATLTGVVLSVQQVMDYNGKLSDSQSDVMKTTGMTKKEVDELTKSFGLFKTRTARIELLKLAEEGGRLGIEGVANIQRWVNVANQMKVALGDDLSETQIREVGKMVQVFKVGEETGRDFEGAMLSLGSAINEVSASGSNQAGFLVDFLKRTGGISSKAKLGAADNLAFAATFDEIGQSAEVAGTVMNKILVDMFTAPGDYAKIAGMDIKSFTELLNTDVNSAMIAFLKGLDGNNAGLTILGQRMADLDIGGSRGVAAVAGLASNLHILEARQETANQAMIDATSLTDEYNIKNNNLAATLEKVKKTVVGWYSSETLIQWLTDGVNWFARFIGATEDTDGSMARFKNGLVLTIKVFAVLLAAMMTNVAWQKLVALWTTRSTQATLLYNLAAKGRAVAENLGKIATLAYIAVTSLLTRNIKTATIATRGLTMALASTPFGALLAIVAACTTAFLLFKDEVKQTNATLLANQKIQEGVGEATNEHKSKVNLLIDVLRSSTSTIEQKEKALIQLKKITNGYLDSLNLENIATLQGINLIGNYIKHIDALARAKATVALKSKLYEELEANNAKIRAKTTEKDTASDGNLFTKHNKDGKFLGIQFGRNKNIIQGEIDELKSDGDFINAQLNAVKKTQNESANYLKKSIEKDKNQLLWLKKGTTEYINLATKIRAEEERLSAFLESGSSDLELKLPNETTSGYIPAGDEKKKKGKSAAEKEAEKQKREHEKRLDEIEKYYESALKLARDYEDGNYALMADGYEKEKQILDTQHQRNIQDLEAKLVSQEEIEKAQNASKNEKLTAEQRKSYENLANAWLKSNEVIYRKVEQETDLHCLKLATTVEKFAQNEIDILNKQYEQEKVAREIAFNDRLTQIGNDQKKRAEEEKKFKDEEYQLELQHLQDLTDLYTKLINNDLGNGIDFDLLTPEAEEKLKADIEKVTLAMSKLKAAKSGESESKKDNLGNGEANLNLGEVDILGFSQAQWETFYSNIEQGTIGIQTMTMAVFALQNIWSQYGALVEAGENRRLQQYEGNANKKQQRLQRQLNSGIISQDQYNKAVEAIDNDLARKKAELEYKQAKRKRKMDMASAFTSTALAVLNGLNTQPFFPLGLAMSALAGIMGGLQIATIAKQPLPSPGFESGYYSNNVVRRQQDGKLFNSTFGGKTKSGVVNRPTHFLTGENGPEMIIDSKAFRQMNPNLRESLIREIREIKGFENGYYNPETMSMNVANDGSISNGEFLVVLIQIRNFLEKLDREGVQAKMSNKDLPSMRNLKEGLQNFENFRNRNKVK